MTILMLSLFSMRYSRSLLLLAVSIMMSSLSLAQDPYYIAIDKTGGLPSNTIYDIYQNTKGFIWIANDEGLTRYDGFEYKTYRSNKQTSIAGDDIQEDKYGRIWYKNFDGYLYYVDHDTMVPLKQNTTIGNSGYAIIGDRLLVLQPGGLDIFDLSTLSVIKNITLDIAMLTSELKCHDRYYLTLGNLLYTISGNGTVEMDSIATPGRMTGTKEGIMICGHLNGTYARYEYSNHALSRKIATPEIKFLQGIDYCDHYYWLYTTSGVWVYDEKGKNINGKKPLFEKLSLSCVLKDRDGNYWLGSLDKGILLIPDINSKLATGTDIIPDRLAAHGNVVYVGTRENTVYTYNTATAAIEKKFSGPVRHDIVCMVVDSLNNKLFLASEKFNILDKDFKTVYSGSFAVKDIAVVDKKYSAFASSGPTGLVKMRDDISSPWDSIYNATAIPDNPVMSNIMNTGRGRTIVYNRNNTTIYTGNNKGFYAITRNKLTELKLNNMPIYTRSLVCFGSTVYVLTPQSELLAVNTDNEITQIPVADDNVQKIKRSGDSVYALTTSGLKIIYTI